MTVVIPMAGPDNAFREAGYGYCKSLIEVGGKPLVQYVWENLRTLAAGKFVFVIRKEDAQRHHLGEVLRLLEPNAVVVTAVGNTAGAACTALLATEHIVPDDELIVTNSDQLFQVDLAKVIENFRSRQLDGGTLVFDSIHPRWSFVQVDEQDLVIQAAEKRPISRLATAGFYYFRRGSDFINCAFEMIRKDAHVNGQFYVCPVFNEMILRHLRIGIHRIDREAYLSLATAQNVEEYEQRLAKQR